MWDVRQAGCPGTCVKLVAGVTMRNHCALHIVEGDPLRTLPLAQIFFGAERILKFHNKQCLPHFVQSKKQMVPCTDEREPCLFSDAFISISSASDGNKYNAAV